EPAQRAVVVDEAAAQPGVPGLEVVDELAQRGAAALDRLLASRVGAEDRRDAHFDRHGLDLLTLATGTACVALVKPDDEPRIPPGQARSGRSGPVRPGQPLPARRPPPRPAPR